MDLEDLKNRFKSKMRADLKDIDIVLRATPFLCREICRVEEELAIAEKRIAFLTEQLNRKMPPMEKEGEREGCRWKAEIDAKHNMLVSFLSGEFDYRTAKIATNQILETIPHLQYDCNVVFDISGISSGSDKKLIFHLRKVVYQIRQIGIKRMALVTDPAMPAIGFVFEEYSEKDGYKVHKASSVEEAKNAILNVDRFLKA
jgi:hypothetical protein